MDPVRFGRALGAGARAAAKTAVQAADAASAPNPGARPGAASAPQRRPSGQGGVSVAKSSAATRDSGGGVDRARQTVAGGAKAARGFREGARRFGREVWGPTVRLSGVLWLEFAGVFFGIFALFALGAAVKLRSAWHTTAANGPQHQRLLGALAMLAAFGYFCVSSFLRAGRRARRR